MLMSGCGGTTQPSAVASPSPTPSPTAAATADPNTIGTSNNPRHGQILVDGGGMTVYLFTADPGATSTCDTTCAGAWPPVTAGSPKAGPGAQASLLGTTTRSDAKVQVTYAGHPLYYFFSDTAPGETNGQGANAFG